MDLLCILLGWYGVREGYLYGVHRKWFQDLPDRVVRISPYIVIASLFIYFTYFAALNYFSYEFLNLFDRDFPANVQAIWKLSEGLYPYATIFQKHYLADHWWPIFWFLSLPYKLFPSPLTILFLNLIGFFVALVAMFLLFLKKTQHKFLAFALCVNLALHPYVQMALVGRSNSDIYSFVFISLAFCFYSYKKYIGYFIFLGAAFLCKEDVPLYFAAAGLWLVFIEKNRKIGWATFGISVIYFIGVTKFLMPHYNDSVSLMNFSRYYDYLGSSIDEIILNAFMKPWLVVGQIFSFSSIISLIFLFGPVLGFIIFSGSSFWLLCVPILIKLLAIRSDMAMFAKHHVWHPLFFIYFATLSGCLYLEDRLSLSLSISKNKVKNGLAIILILSGCLASLVYPFLIRQSELKAQGTGIRHLHSMAGMHLYWKEYIGDSRVELVKKALRSVPQSASLLSDINVLAYSPNRERIHELNKYHGELAAVCCMVDCVEYVLVDNLNPRSNHGRYFRFVKGRLLTYINKSSNWDLVFNEGSVLVFKRRHDLFKPDDHFNHSLEFIRNF
ncbi:DUF2079 domain-containing protein [bacterium]|nr:DUF2079 domain-containing protein [bacterium]